MTTKIGEKLITHCMNRSKHIKENNCSNFKFLSNILSSTLKISSRVKGPRSLSYYKLCEGKYKIQTTNCRLEVAK